MRKNLKYYLNLKYTARIKKNSDGTYFAEVEELPGCMTEANTKVDVLIMLDDAKEAWLETAQDRGIDIPEPSEDNFSGKFNVRVPKFLHRKLAYRAKSEGVSLNTLITTTLASATK